jgi:tyrosyl-tRNA synthetase
MSDAANPAQTQETTQNVVTVLSERGLVSQITENGLYEAAAKGSQGPLTVYCGFDPTAPSLQLGNLVPVMALAHFQRLGHRPILLVGGGTGMIGDPSGKSSERPLLTPEQVADYVARIRAQLARYLSFEGPSAAVVVNNADWLDKFSLIGFLRDIGKHFPVNAMLAKETVQSRLEGGISYTEFSYMLLQATDYLHLFDHLGCTVQIGGHDQWGNLTAGVDLIRRVRGARVNALTVPLVTSTSGAKFGKSEGNALWLDPELTAPYQLYQYFINVDDRDVAHYLRVFTFLPLNAIAGIEQESVRQPERRAGQRALAFEIVKLVHGEAVAEQVRAASNVLFGGGLAELTPEALPHLASAVPTSPLPAGVVTDAVANGTSASPVPSLLDTLVAVGAQPSKGAARRLMAQGGVYVNEQRWTDAERSLAPGDLLFGRAVLLRLGKNKYHLLLAER